MEYVHTTIAPRFAELWDPSLPWFAVAAFFDNLSKTPDDLVLDNVDQLIQLDQLQIENNALLESEALTVGRVIAKPFNVIKRAARATKAKASPRRTSAS